MTSRQRGIWPLVSDRTRELLARHATPVDFRHGQHIIEQGAAETDVFVIRSGFVRW